MRYDRARTSLHRHATYNVAAFIAGAARYARSTGFAWPLSAARQIQAWERSC
jgi:hypothetical protein